MLAAYARCPPTAPSELLGEVSTISIRKTEHSEKLSLSQRHTAVGGDARLPFWN